MPAPAPVPVAAPPPAPKPAPVPTGSAAGAISVEDALVALNAAQGVFVDARLPNGFVFGHVPGSVNIPAAQFDAAFAAHGASLPHDKKIIVYCADANCPESVQVIEALAKKGFTDILRLNNGWAAWAGAGYPVQRGFGQP